MPQWLLILQLVLPMLQQLMPVVEQLGHLIGATNDPATKAALQAAQDTHKAALTSIITQTSSALKSS